MTIQCTALTADLVSSYDELEAEASQFSGKKHDLGKK